MSKKALIVGVSGQDGALLSALLLDKGYEVHGTSRDAQMSGFANLERLGIRDGVRMHSTVTTDFRSVLQVLSKVAPDEIYSLAGQSSVGLSFEQPVETLESIALGTLNLLEAMRFVGRRSGCTTPDRANASARPRGPAGQRRTRHSVRAAPTRWRSRVRTGRSPTIARPTDCSPAPASSSTTNRHCGRRAS